MSIRLILPTVTAVLKNLLENGLVESNDKMPSLGDLKVTAQPPDCISVSGTDDQARLNLYLCQLTQNHNAEWIAQERKGDRWQSGKNSDSINPLLALNLQYLLTAYSSKDLETEGLLGSAIQLLRDITPITRDTIHTTMQHIADNTDGFLAQALAATSITDLSEQIGKIEIYPKFLDTEEMSKLWSNLGGSYRPSIVYEVSSLLIVE